MHLMVAQHREDGDVVEGHADDSGDGVNVAQIDWLGGVPDIVGYIVAW